MRWIKGKAAFARAAARILCLVRGAKKACACWRRLANAAVIGKILVLLL